MQAGICLAGFVDSDMAGGGGMLQSTAGYVFFLGMGMI